MKNLIFLFALLYTIGCVAQDIPPSDYGRYRPLSQLHSELKLNVPIKRIEAQDNIKLIKKYRSNSSGFNVYAIGKKVNINLKNAGTWKTLDDGRKVWLCKIESPTSEGLQLVWDKFKLPKGAALFIYDEFSPFKYGPYTHADNKVHGRFSPGLFHSRALYLELNLAKGISPAEIQFNIGEIADAFYNPILGKLPKEKSQFPSLYPNGRFNWSMNCIPDVQCMPWKEEWCNEIRSTVLLMTKRLVEGVIEWGTGTASIVNTVRIENDNPITTVSTYQPYLLTGAHNVNGIESEDWIVLIITFCGDS